jgi:iron complex outermembrane receptor protein
MREWGRLYALLCLNISLAANVHAEEALVRFNIPAAEARTGLNLFAHQSGTPVLYMNEVLGSRRTNAVNGKLSVRQALEILLRHTDISGVINEAGVLTISVRISENNAVSGETTMQENENHTKRGAAFLAAIAAFFAPGFAAHADENSSTPPAATDALQEIIVTGVFIGTEKSKATVAISTVNSEEIGRLQSISPTDLLRNVPGVYVDSSQGVIGYGTLTEPQGRFITSRGLGFVQIEEDGLPLLGTAVGSNVFLAGNNYSFLRADETLDHIEVVRGGSAAITGANAPGGLFNYISKTGGETLSSTASASYGLQGDGRLPYERFEFNSGGPLAGDGWYFDVGGFYQHDYGTHDAGYPLDYGGQLKGNIIKKFGNGSIEIYAKYLNDHNAYSQLIPGVDWNSPHPARGWGNTSSQLLNPVSFPIQTGPNSSAGYNNENLEHITSTSIGMMVDFYLGNNWSISNNLKYSHSAVDTFIAINPWQDSLDDFAPYLLLGTLGMPGTYTFTNPASGRSAQVISKTGSDFTVLNNNLPGTPGVPNGVYTENPNPNESTVDEFQDQLTVTKKFDTMSFTGGAYFDHSNPKSSALGSVFGFATLTPQPQMLNITLQTPAGKALQVTNPAGFGSSTALGGQGFTHGKWDQVDVFFGHHWELAGWTLDWGARYEEAKSDGFTANPGSVVTTSSSSNLYANTYSVPGSGPTFDYETRFHTLAYSAAIGREIDESNAIYLRYTLGKNAPGIQTYPNATAAQQSPPPLPQKIVQWELGYKFHKPGYSIDITPYYSVLTQIAQNGFPVVPGPDSGNGGWFVATTPANKTSNTGVELDGRFDFGYGFALRTAVTWQKSKEIDSFNWVLKPGVTALTAFDYSGLELIDVNAGNKALDIPDVLATITPSYTRGPFLAQLQWQYVGAREGNNSDAFVMPAYDQTNLTLRWNFTERLLLSFIANNVFNSVGITEWGAPGNILSGPFGTASYTRAQVLANPNAVFYIQQIPARAYFLKASYNF